MARPSDTVYLIDDNGQRYDAATPRWCGDGGSPVILSPLQGLHRQDILADERSMWRYRRGFAFDYARPIKLGEGWTPLLERAFHGQNLNFKLEWFNPTGSFKDRGSSLVASTLTLQGIEKALTDSSGNGGSSLSAYCAVANIDLTVMVPADTSQSKVTQARAYGARVELVPGGRDLVQGAALEQSKMTFYSGHNWHPFFLDGIKTLGYELWEQLGFSAPDNIVVVAGAGSIALGCDVAFSELLGTGQIEKRPRLLLAQSQCCCPIYNAFHSLEADLGVPGSGARTLAEGAAIPKPVRINHVVEAVRRSNGTVVTVTEAEIGQATRDLAGMGFYCEPTSAVSAAAITRLTEQGFIGPDQTTVVVLTGSGLKVSATMGQIFAS